jgi:hypothetical protein
MRNGDGRYVARFFGCVVIVMLGVGCKPATSPDEHHPVAEEPLVLSAETKQPGDDSGGDMSSGGSSGKSLAGVQLGASMKSFGNMFDANEPPSPKLTNVSDAKWKDAGTHPKIVGTESSSTRLGFKSNKLIYVSIFISGVDSCKKLRKHMEGKFGSPTSTDDSKMMGDLSSAVATWKKSDVYANFTDYPESKKDGSVVSGATCIATLADARFVQ